MRELPDGELRIADWPDLPADELTCLKWLLREGEVTVDQTSRALIVAAAEALRLLSSLVERKLAVLIEERVVYVGNVGRRTARFRAGGLWDSLASRLIDEP